MKYVRGSEDAALQFQSLAGWKAGENGALQLNVSNSAKIGLLAGAESLITELAFCSDTALSASLSFFATIMRNQEAEVISKLSRSRDVRSVTRRGVRVPIGTLSI